MSSLKTSARIGVKGVITRIEKYNFSTGEKTIYPGCRNLITDSGLEAYNSDVAVIGSCLGLGANAGYLAVGDGSSTPDSTDTSLDNEFGVDDSVANIDQSQVSDSGNDIYYAYYERVHVFDPGTATGNLTEFGIYTQDQSALGTRELFRDQNGDPTTITKLADEELRITYQLRIYFDYNGTYDNSGTVDINGTTYNYTIGQVGFSDSDFWSGSPGRFADSNIVAVPEGEYSSTATLADFRFTVGVASNSDDANNSTQSSIVDGNTYRTFESTFSSGNANFSNDIEWFFIAGPGSNPNGAFAIKFDPAVPKSDTEELTIAIRYRLGRQ